MYPHVNPYQAPSYDGGRGDARRQVMGPAIALIVVSSIGLLVGAALLAMNLFLVVSGATEKLAEASGDPTLKHSQVTVRSIWELALVGASSYVLYGAIRMVNLKSYNDARTAAILAMIPMVGPCCFLGIPFGVWAFVVLGRPDVKAAFV